MNAIEEKILNHIEVLFEDGELTFSIYKDLCNNVKKAFSVANEKKSDVLGEKTK